MCKIVKQMGKINPMNWEKIVIVEKCLVVTPNSKHYEHPPITPSNLNANLHRLNIVNHCYTPATSHYTKLIRTKMFYKSIPKLNN